VAKSFLKRISPFRDKSKFIDWPFPVDGDDKPKIKMRVLAQNDIEQAYFATVDYFKGRKPAVSVEDVAFAARERAELVFLAYSADGAPLDEDTDELVSELGKEAISELYATWSQFQADTTGAPATAKEMDLYVEYLKKSGDATLLTALSSSKLLSLISTLANRLNSSTPASEHGS
jgi:hypothetical protein